MDSKGTLKLKAPLLVNGVELCELNYDFDKLTAADMIEADKQRYDDTGRPALAPIIDRATQLNLFALAVEKTGSAFTHEDMPRLSYRDAVRAANLARDFTSAEDGDGEEGEELDNPSSEASEDGAVPISRKRSANSDT